jgi:choline dehydrogenase-like flavoprotein
VSDYDDWAELTGDESWSSTHMMKYMRMHQTLEPFDEKVIDRTTYPFVGDNHGLSGPIRTGFNDNAMEIDDSIIKAADEAAGLTKKPIDPWSGDHIGFYNTLGAIYRTGEHKGKRSYAARGYFEENQHRPNLKVITESLVAKVVIEGGVATGVQFINNGQKHAIKAKKEVIVSGGTIGSPQMLELSGVGDSEVLTAAGVECLVNLPGVGNNLQDHMVTWITYKLAPGLMSGDSMERPEVMAHIQQVFAETSGGPMTNISPVQGFYPIKWMLEEGELEEIIKSIENIKGGGEFARRQRKLTIEQLKSDKSGNMQFILIPITPGGHRAIPDQSQLFKGGDLSGPDGIGLVTCLQFPVSRGSTHIKSTDPAVHPVIDPNYLGEQADVDLMAAGMKFLDKMTKSDALKGKLGKQVLPSPQDFNISTSEGRKKAVRDLVAVGSYLDQVNIC